MISEQQNVNCKYEIPLVEKVQEIAATLWWKQQQEIPARTSAVETREHPEANSRENLKRVKVT